MVANVIIIAVLLVACVFAARGAYRHFTGKGACCNGGGDDFVPEADKKLEGDIISEKKIRVEGMTCQNCANTVKRAINSVEGASGKVNLRKGMAVVDCDRPVSDADLKAAIESAGYRVAAIA